MKPKTLPKQMKPMMGKNMKKAMLIIPVKAKVVKGKKKC